MILLSKMSAFSTIFFLTTIIMALTGCDGKKNKIPQERREYITTRDRTIADTTKGTPGKIPALVPINDIGFDFDQPDSLIDFAKTLIGVPYLYACTDPSKGLDCSGFVTYVFNHFNIAIPRSSVDFTNFGRDIVLEKARPGDLILFTGTDSSDLTVGHMGIVESIKDDTLRFIHSTSGKAKGVVISPLGDHYKKRFVKVIRVFRD